MSGDGIWGRCNMETDLNSSLGEQLEDPELKAEYDALEPEFAAVQAQIDVKKADSSACNKVKAFKHLQELFKDMPDNIDLDKVREERLK